MQNKVSAEEFEKISVEGNPSKEAETTKYPVETLGKMVENLCKVISENNVEFKESSRKFQQAIERMDKNFVEYNDNMNKNFKEYNAKMTQSLDK